MAEERRGELDAKAAILNRTVDILPEAFWRQEKATYDVEQGTRKLITTNDDLVISIQNQVVPAISEMEETGISAAEALKRAYDDFSYSLGGEMGSAVDDFNEKQEELRAENQELISKIDELNSKKYLTDAQKEELEGLKSQLVENREEMAANGAAFEERSRRIMFSLLQERAMMKEAGEEFGQITEDELTFLTKVAEAWGLVDEHSVEAMSNANAALAMVNDGELSRALKLMGALGEEAQSAAGRYNIHFNITQSGTIPSTPGHSGASGGGSGQYSGDEDKYQEFASALSTPQLVDVPYTGWTASFHRGEKMAVWNERLGTPGGADMTPVVAAVQSLSAKMDRLLMQLPRDIQAAVAQVV